MRYETGPLWKQYGLGILGFIFLAAALSSWRNSSEWPLWPFRTAFFVLGSWLIVQNVRQARYWPGHLPQSRRGGQPDYSDAETQTELAERVRRTQRRSYHYNLADRSAELLAEMLVYPDRHRVRTEEDLSISGREVIRSVRIDFCVDGVPDSEMLLVPILRPKKGDLISGFSVQDDSGRSLTTLSYDETLAVLSSVVRALLLGARGIPEANGEEQAGVLRSSGGSHESELQKLIADYETRLLKQVIKTEDKDEVEFGNPEKSAEAEALADLLSKLMMVLKKTYPIIVVLSLDRAAEVAGTTFFKIAYCERPTLCRFLPPSPPPDKYREKLRKALVAAPSRLDISVREAFQAASYHLSVHAPVGYYVGESGFLRTDDDGGEVTIVRRPSSVGSGAPHHNVVRGPMQPYAHLYTRSLNSLASGGENLVDRAKFSVRFYEELPGSLGRASVIAPLTLFAVWVVAFAQSASESPAGPDLVALALALPALAASWLGSESQSVVGVSLMARTSLAISVLFSLLGVALYIAQAASRLDVYRFGGFSFLYISDVLWASLLFLCVLNVVVTVTALVARFARAGAVAAKYSNGRSVTY